MSIYVRYGNYSHGVGEVEYTITREALLTAREVAYAHRTTVQMQGMLVADSSSEMDGYVKSLKAAYARPDRDWLVMLNNRPLDISIYARDCISGVTVQGGVSFPSNKNAAYVTHLPYSITLTADVAIADQSRALKSFSEKLRFSGGGPRFLHIETAVGLPVKQIGRRHTVYRAVQSGSAVGLYARPIVPQPLWPNDQIENVEYELDSGQYRGDTRTDLGVTWTYRFESARRMFGTPNAWGRT